MARWTDLATWRGPSPNSGPALKVHRGLVLHIAQGYFEGTIAWQRNPAADTASHFIGGKVPGERAQMVDTDTQAWCQRAGNSSWMSLELIGFVPDAMTPAQIEFAAQLFARGHREYGWPLRVARNPSESGLGHHSMDREGIDPEWGHDACPGNAIIAQKQQVVDRAIQIMGGSTVTPEQEAKLLAQVSEIWNLVHNGLRNGPNQTTTPRDTDRAYPFGGFLGISQPIAYLPWLDFAGAQRLAAKAVSITEEQMESLAQRTAELVIAELPEGADAAQIEAACERAMATVLRFGTESVDVPDPVEEDEPE